MRKLFCILLLFTLSFPSVLKAQNINALSKRIEGCWKDSFITPDSTNICFMWCFKKEYKTTGFGYLCHYVNDSITQKPRPFVWMIHQLVDEAKVIQIRFYEDKVDYPILEFDTISKKEIRFRDPDQVLYKTSHSYKEIELIAKEYDEKDAAKK